MEKVAGESEICLTLVSEARRDGQEGSLKRRGELLLLHPLTSSRYHGSNDSQDPVFVERRLSNLNSDISGDEWLERAMNLGIWTLYRQAPKTKFLGKIHEKSCSLKPAVSHRKM